MCASFGFQNWFDCGITLGYDLKCFTNWYRDIFLSICNNFHSAHSISICQFTLTLDLMEHCAFDGLCVVLVRRVGVYKNEPSVFYFICGVYGKGRL